MVKPLSGALYILAMMCIIHCGLRVLPPLPKGQNLVQGTHKSSLEATGTDRLTSTRAGLVGNQPPFLKVVAPLCLEIVSAFIVLVAIHL